MKSGECSDRAAKADAWAVIHWNIRAEILSKEAIQNLADFGYEWDKSAGKWVLVGVKPGKKSN